MVSPSSRSVKARAVRAAERKNIPARIRTEPRAKHSREGAKKAAGAACESYGLECGQPSTVSRDGSTAKAAQPSAEYKKGRVEIVAYSIKTEDIPCISTPPQNERRDAPRQRGKELVPQHEHVLVQPTTTKRIHPVRNHPHPRPSKVPRTEALRGNPSSCSEFYPPASHEKGDAGEGG